MDNLALKVQGFPIVAVVGRRARVTSAEEHMQANELHNVKLT